MSLSSRRFYEIDASEQHDDGTADHLYLRCRKLDPALAAEMGELLPRVLGAFVNEDDEPEEEQEDGEGLEGIVAIFNEIDPRAASLVVAYSEQPPGAPERTWRPLRLVLNITEDDGSDGVLWIGALPMVVRQEVLTRGIEEVSAAEARVRRFRSRSAAAAGDDGAGRGDAPEPAAVAG